MVGSSGNAEIRTEYPIVQGLTARTTSQTGHDTCLEPENSFVDVKNKPLSSQGINTGG